MNERIKQLWDDAALAAGDESQTWDGQVAFMALFAELIVREMCGMMEQCQDDISSGDPSEVNWGYVSQLGDWIEIFKKHFGVEE